jgi:hypothetical protein
MLQNDLEFRNLCTSRSVTQAINTLLVGGRAMSFSYGPDPSPTSEHISSIVLIQWNIKHDY